MAARKTALRNVKTGMLFPMNENLMEHDDIEMVQIGADNKVIEPEEVGPAAAMDLPEPEPESEQEEAKATTTATAATRRKRS